MFRNLLQMELSALRAAMPHVRLPFVLSELSSGMEGMGSTELRANKGRRREGIKAWVYSTSGTKLHHVPGVYLTEFSLSYSERKEYLFIILTVNLRFSNTLRGCRTRKGEQG